MQCGLSGNSVPVHGNIPARTLMGNPLDGDAWQSAGKYQPNLKPQDLLGPAVTAFYKETGVALLRKKQG